MVPVDTWEHATCRHIEACHLSIYSSMITVAYRIHRNTTPVALMAVGLSTSICTASAASLSCSSSACRAFASAFVHACMRRRVGARMCACLRVAACAAVCVAACVAACVRARAHRHVQRRASRHARKDNTCCRCSQNATSSSWTVVDDCSIPSIPVGTLQFKPIRANGTSHRQTAACP